MKVLVVNAGSSSLKYQLIDMTTESTLAKGLVERIGIDGTRLKQEVNGDKYVLEQPMKNHVVASQFMLDALTDKVHGVLSNMDEIAAVGHRVLHGGEKFTQSVIIDDEVIEAIKENIPLGPLHNPANLMGIMACHEVMPNTPMVAVFDTAFHQTMPPKAFLYGVPIDYYERLHVRRYGFHGTSHRYVSARAAEFLGKDINNLRIITCHLGNGSSIAAVHNGKCVDTSMGITPLEGLLMGTRSGSMDPAVLQYIMNNDGINIDEMLEILNKKSGLLGVSGVSSDMRDVDTAAESGNKNALVAQQILDMGIKKYIGAYAAVMGGVDVIVFTAGIGENGIELRERVMEDMSFLGAAIDKEKNKVKGKEADISADDSKVKVVVIPTNEELVIARDTLELVNP
ncbi:MAG: acetate/propionate family kinase [Christensenellales bacterium]|jgi:acetate kinase|nr:acetate kinase [Christensenellaceae bacterium]